MSSRSRHHSLHCSRPTFEDGVEEQVQRQSRTSPLRPPRPPSDYSSTSKRARHRPGAAVQFDASPLFFCRSPFRQVFLLLSIFLYQFVGALLFLICEAENQRQREEQWERELNEKRRQLVEKVGIRSTTMLMNDTQSQILEKSLLSALVGHDQMLVEWRGKHPQMRWDFWNAMLFSLSLFTTIGYGHLYARTKAGRLLTMLYALGGIPLLMLVLDELGSLLSRFLLASWFLLKCACRRAFRNCTHQTSPEIRALDAEDRQELRHPTELPLEIALVALFGWICLCASLSCLWEHQWGFVTAFYFFFTSLTTIGLGDVVPTQPKYSLLLTTCLIIGLAFVSMTIGLIQAKWYARGANFAAPHQQHSSSLPPHDYAIDDTNNDNGQSDGNSRRRRRHNHLLQRNPCGSSLGIFSTNTSSSRGSGVREKLRRRQWHNKCTQTLLSFPNPAIRDDRVARTIEQNMRMLPRAFSIDDVMRLVDTEEGDILLLSELTLSRDISGLSGETSGTTADGTAMSSSSSTSSELARIWTSESERTTSSSSEGTEEADWMRGCAQQQQHMMVMSRHGLRSFDRCCRPTSTNAIPPPQMLSQKTVPLEIPLILPLFTALLGHPPTDSMTDLELLEEFEDRMLLCHGGTSTGGTHHHGRTCPQVFAREEKANGPGTGGVHFRSRLSLIPEQQSLDEEQEAAHSHGTIEEIGGGTSESDSKRWDGAKMGDDVERNGGRTRPNSTSWSGEIAALLKGDLWKRKGKRSGSLTNDNERANKNEERRE